jgi:hypothetical protein
MACIKPCRHREFLLVGHRRPPIGLARGKASRLGKHFALLETVERQRLIALAEFLGIAVLVLPGAQRTIEPNILKSLDLAPAPPTGKHIGSGVPATVFRTFYRCHHHHKRSDFSKKSGSAVRAT